MYRTTRIRKIGSSLGAILPKEILDDMSLASGDELLVIRTEQGVMLTPYDPNFADAMAVFERGRGKYRNALRDLAK